METGDGDVRVISTVSKQLAAYKSCPSKDILVKLLRQAAGALPKLGQSASLKPSIKPLSDSLVKFSLLQHNDRDVRLLVATCVCGIIRVLAPNPDFTDAVFGDIFKLFVSLFSELADTKSTYFFRRLEILETVAKLNVCVLMLDMHHEDLVLKMFNTFFTVVRENHPDSLFEAMSSIIAVILKERISLPLVHLVLRNLLKERKGSSPASFRLATTVIQMCEEELGPCVCGFLMDCIMGREGAGNQLREFYHEIIYGIFQCAPLMLTTIIPSLTQELMTDQVDVRIKALNLVGRLLALPRNCDTQTYQYLYLEFVKRFSDISAEVRLTALSCAKTLYMSNPRGAESYEILTTLESRLLDYDDRVRTHAMVITCDLIRSNMKAIPKELVSLVIERLRDKKLSVRKKSFQKLLEVYQDYCTKCSAGIIEFSEQFEQIPCKIMMLCYDKDCKEFRPQNMELVFVDELFPSSLSVAERTKHWISFFKLFTPLHLKALETILSQKKRLQCEMKAFLALQREVEENGSEESQRRTDAIFCRISSLFPDPSKAEDGLHKLILLKDYGIYSALEQVLDEGVFENYLITRNNFLSKIGHKNPQHGFLQLLFAKCSYSIFTSDHVSCLFDDLDNEEFESNRSASRNLLMVIINAFPSLLRGLEKRFLHFMEDCNASNDDLVKFLANAGSHICIKLSDVYNMLERICLEGTRAQAKLAISAIAALMDNSEKSVYTELCKTLVHSLYNSQNVPTVLQSLGCMAQHSVSTFEDHAGKITGYIVKNILQSSNLAIPDGGDSFNENFECCVSCRWKIFGIKTLVKSYLPHHQTPVRRDIKQLLDIVMQMLQTCDSSDGIFSCESDKAIIRLVAAKSVLRLSRKWDPLIPSQVFRLTILTSKDSPSSIGRLFIEKVHKLLKESILPIKYACVFSLAAADFRKDLHDESLQFMEEFIRKYSKEAYVREEGLIRSPVYIVVFLIHILAHDMNFLPENHEEEMYAQFVSPLVFTIQALVNAKFVDSELDVAVSYLQRIFHAVRRAEDSVDTERTLKLHILADLGLSILNTLNNGTNRKSHAPDQILLPSSLYSKSTGEDREMINVNNSDWHHLNAKIAKEVASTFEYQIVHASSCSRFNDVAASENGKCKALDSLFPESNNNSKANEIIESVGLKNDMHEALNKGKGRSKKRRAMPPIPCESVVMQDEFAILDEHQTIGCRESEPSRGRKELVSSCDSARVKPSKCPKEGLENSSSEVCAVAKENSITIATPKNASGTGSVTDDGNNGQQLVGQKIRLWSPLDNCYFSADVDEFDPQNKKHKITYENGEVEVLSLDSKSWDSILNNSLLDSASKRSDVKNCFTVDKRRKVFEAPQMNACEQSSFLKKRKQSRNMKLTSGKENNQETVHGDTSVSELTNIVRRSRRHK
ncbi:sister chromatid cohesion protein PDS5 homolog B [Impatiens glandulifera]|uniref:sister chromatid cohesion protein PDS5 homolog B n=1 Tax=Impatiens glandulifera TaxID=253017 RepID=UPI001FB0E443|nr:sister chromatid cohesion protein PDS5 homolog B [Impatiens glandulifera]